MKDNRNSIEVFETLCQMLDELELDYTKEEKFLGVRVSFEGNRYPIHFVIVLSEDSDVISYYSIFPFRAEKEHLVEMAIAASAINYKMINGCFSVNLTDGSLQYKITSCYRECAIGKEMLHYLFDLAFDTVKTYNEPLADIGNGTLSLDDFLTNLQK